MSGKGKSKIHYRMSTMAHVPRFLIHCTVAAMVASCLACGRQRTCHLRNCLPIANSMEYNATNLQIQGYHVLGFLTEECLDSLASDYGLAEKPLRLKAFLSVLDYEQNLDYGKIATSSLFQDLLTNLVFHYFNATTLKPPSKEDQPTTLKPPSKEGNQSTTSNEDQRTTLTPPFEKNQPATTIDATGSKDLKLSPAKRIRKGEVQISSSPVEYINQEIHIQVTPSPTKLALDCTPNVLQKEERLTMRMTDEMPLPIRETAMDIRSKSNEPIAAAINGTTAAAVINGGIGSEDHNHLSPEDAMPMPLEDKMPVSVNTAINECVKATVNWSVLTDDKPSPTKSAKQLKKRIDIGLDLNNIIFHKSRRLKESPDKEEVTLVEESLVEESPVEDSIPDKMPVEEAIAMPDKETIAEESPVEDSIPDKMPAEEAIAPVKDMTPESPLKRLQTRRDILDPREYREKPGERIREGHALHSFKLPSSPKLRPKLRPFLKLCKRFLARMIKKPLGEPEGFKVVVEMPNGNNPRLNILRDAPIRALFGLNKGVSENGNVLRFAYGSGSGTGSIGCDPRTFEVYLLDRELKRAAIEMKEVLSECQRSKDMGKSLEDMSIQEVTAVEVKLYAGKKIKAAGGTGIVEETGKIIENDKL